MAILKSGQRDRDEWASIESSERERYGLRVVSGNSKKAIVLQYDNA